MLLSHGGWMAPNLGDMIAQLLANIGHDIGVISAKKGTKVTEYRILLSRQGDLRKSDGVPNFDPYFVTQACFIFLLKNITLILSGN